jgi:hypothetical protein
MKLIVFLLGLILTALSFAEAANHVFMTEYISSTCDGSAEKETPMGLPTNCLAISGESSVMVTCEEYKEYPNANCEGAPIRISNGCFNVASNPEVYFKIACKDIEMTTSLEAGTTRNKQNNCSANEKNELDEVVLPPIKVYSSSPDENVIVLAQTSAGNQVSSPYAIFVSVAIFFVIF